MSGLRDWGSQPAGAPPVGFEKTTLYPWASINWNPDPSNDPADTPAWADFDDFFGLENDIGGIAAGDGTFNIMFELYALAEERGGNPYQDIRAYNPDDDIARMERALEDFSTAVAQYSPDTDVPGMVALAREQTEIIIGDDLIDATIAAERARMETDHLSNVSSTLMGLWEAGAVVAPQVFTSIAILDDGFNRTINQFATRLRLAREEQRANISTQMVQIALSQKDRSLAMRQVYVAVAIESLRFRATAKQDQTDKDFEYIMGEKFWNVSLLQMALNSISSFQGQIVPRQQTKGERLLAALSGSVSLGIQGGQALGNPGAGVALGGVNLLGQLFLGQ